MVVRYLVAVGLLAGCSREPRVPVFDTAGGTEGTTGSDATTGPVEGTTGPVPPTPDPSGDTTGDDSIKLDVMVADLGDAPSLCEVHDDIDGIGPCADGPLPSSFEMEVQWSWTSPGVNSLVTPLVANLTDDDGNGTIDLCDTPDIVVLTLDGTVIVFDGDSPEGGLVHWQVDAVFTSWQTPALGDIDGDGLVEIVGVGFANGADPRSLVALNHDGTIAFETDPIAGIGGNGHVALADLDADGDVEIVVDGIIADHEGQVLHLLAPHLAHGGSSGFAVDLDGDDDLEVINTFGAFHHDGTMYFQNEGPGSHASAHVADIDDDGLPEVMYASPNGGLTIYEHDGTLRALRVNSQTIGVPSAVHDIDGDGTIDFLSGNGSNEAANFAAAEISAANIAGRWSVDVQGGCCAGATAFDFLGDGTAEPLFADDVSVYIFDELGTELTTVPRASGTLTDYPVVADVDNDGAAEIVVVGASWVGATPPEEPTVQVLRDANDGWAPARRIWNQHAYHVTNVREDGTIPEVQPKNWETLNTFRTQAQIGSNGVCIPEG